MKEFKIVLFIDYQSLFFEYESELTEKDKEWLQEKSVDGFYLRIETTWELPFLPNREDNLDFVENLLGEDAPDAFSEFTWSIDYISYKIDSDKNIIPNIYLKGE